MLEAITSAGYYCVPCDHTLMLDILPATMPTQMAHLYENTVRYVNEDSTDSGFESLSLSSCGSSVKKRRCDEHYLVPCGAPVRVISTASVIHDDLTIVKSSVGRLKEAQLYYPNMGQEEAKRILKDKPVGTFLVRNSSSPCYLFTLSVKTARGPTSIRVKYSDGQFKLDSTSQHNLPSFPGMMELLEFYMGISKPPSSHRCASIILETGGKKTSVKLITPYIQSTSLKNECRRTICRLLRSPEDIKSLPLTDNCKQYLKENPHRL